jgi:hypothetical protein
VHQIYNGASITGDNSFGVAPARRRKRRTGATASLLPRQYDKPQSGSSMSG